MRDCKRGIYQPLGIHFRSCLSLLARLSLVHVRFRLPLFGLIVPVSLELSLHIHCGSGPRRDRHACGMHLSHPAHFTFTVHLLERAVTPPEARRTPSTKALDPPHDANPPARPRTHTVAQSTQT